MYLMSCLAAPACFPSVAQEEITQDDWECTRGRSGLEEFRDILPRWNRTRTGLAESCFRPTERVTEIPRPIAGQKTCTSAAHSQQVALEECLLDCALMPDGTFETTTALTHSWSSSLVFTVQQTAVGVLEPSVLVHETSGSAYLIVLSLGRCVWGWPLRVESAEKMLLVMAHPIQALVPIVLTSPYLGPAIPIQAIHCPASEFRFDHILFQAVQSEPHSWQTHFPLFLLRCWCRYGGDKYMDLPVRVVCDKAGSQVLRRGYTFQLTTDL
jgi:hypothetical protein